MSFGGADTARLRGLASQADQVLDTVRGARTLLVDLRSTLPTLWVGADSEKFVTRIDGEHLPVLDRVIARLERATGEMRSHAQRQDETSERLR